MKHPHLLFLLPTLLLTACKDNLNIADTLEPARLTVYCLPAPGDSTRIAVYRSLPVPSRGNVKAITDARISYRVNGHEYPVRHTAYGQYMVYAPQKAGDCIMLEVAADGLENTHAEAVIPPTVVIDSMRMTDIRLYDDDYQSVRNFHRFAVTFTDDGRSNDFYGVCITKTTVRDYPGYGDSFTATDNMGINRKSEPLLRELSEVDKDFGFEDETYNNFYVFDDATINGKTYTLHLDTPTDYSHYGKQSYQVRLYRLTPEFYRFVTNINDVANNELAKAGLSYIKPTPTNIRGGLGLLGACTVAKSDSVNISQNNDNNNPIYHETKKR